MDLSCKDRYSPRRSRSGKILDPDCVDQMKEVVDCNRVSPRRVRLLSGSCPDENHKKSNIKTVTFKDPKSSEIRVDIKERAKTLGNVPSNQSQPRQRTQTLVNVSNIPDTLGPSNQRQSQNLSTPTLVLNSDGVFRIEDQKTFPEELLRRNEEERILRREKILNSSKRNGSLPIPIDESDALKAYMAQSQKGFQGDLPEINKNFKQPTFRITTEDISNVRLNEITKPYQRGGGTIKVSGQSIDETLRQNLEKRRKFIGNTVQDVQLSQQI